ncbi:MAG: 2-oxoacid:ferredoxin oxidoreductase subunit beta [Anaerolineaceae bacterium]|nr:2-oxoacid:ferredoxin oxidoreductase subunit beta [Anaerolineaceae bacterium]
MKYDAGRDKKKFNALGYERKEYGGSASTLCQGCGHNSIASQIIAACYELDIIPEKLAKFSGIGCSSKSPNYFLNRSFGFNGLHGRMPSLALGALFADTTVKGIGVSGDGDTASIGMGQFKHLGRRNLPLVYIVENNGVYGLTKGQFSATSEKDLELKHQGVNQYIPVDICMEALIGQATFVARTFAGDPKQVKELIKAALVHNGLAVLDIISPCVTFHNKDEYLHSYMWGRQHELPLHDLAYIPPQEEIIIEEFEEGSIKEVKMHDGSHLYIKKLGRDYDPTSKSQAINLLHEAQVNGLLLTGLLYMDTSQPTTFDLHNLVDVPLNRLKEESLRPKEVKLVELNNSFK